MINVTLSYFFEYECPKNLDRVYILKIALQLMFKEQTLIALETKLN